MADSLTSLAVQHFMQKLPPQSISSELLGVIANIDLPDIDSSKNLFVIIKNEGSGLNASLEYYTPTQKQIIPIELKSTLSDLKLAPTQQVKIEAKLIENTPEKIELKILNIKLPENSKPLEINNNVIIKELNSYKQTTSLTPLKLDLPRLEIKPQLVLELVAIEGKSLNIVKQTQLPIDLKTLPSIEALKQAIEQIKAEKIVGEVVKIPLSSNQINQKNILPTPLNSNASNITKDVPQFLNVIKTPLGNVFPQTPLNLPEKTLVSLQIKELIIPTLHESKSNEPLPKLLSALTPIKEEKPELFSKIIAKIPAPDKNILSNIISVVKANISKNIDDFFGPKLSAEIRVQPQVIREHIEKISEIIIPNKNETSQPNNQFRIIEMPFFNGDVYSKIKIAIKHDQEEKTVFKNKKNASTRFVLETSFSQLGNFQFDGFAIKNDKRFDLVIRTQNQMREDFISHVTNIFKKSLIDVEYAGTISINKQQFLKIFDEKPTPIEGIYI